VYLHSAGDSINASYDNTARIGKEQTTYYLQEQLPYFPAESGITPEASASNLK